MTPSAVQPLYDLGPLLQMLLLGAAIALLPLAWVWRRNRGPGRSRRWQALTVLTLFLTFDLVLFGAFTRLTDSGLGCPDWPGCYGSASPVGARTHIAAAQEALPSGPVTHGKAWVEMVHRYWPPAWAFSSPCWPWRLGARAGVRGVVKPMRLLHSLQSLCWQARVCQPSRFCGCACKALLVRSP